MLFKIFTSGLICGKTKLETHTHAETESACLLLKLHQCNNLTDPQIPELHQTHLHEDIESEDQAIPSSKCYSHCQCQSKELDISFNHSNSLSQSWAARIYKHFYFAKVQYQQPHMFVGGG